MIPVHRLDSSPSNHPEKVLSSMSPLMYVNENMLQALHSHSAPGTFYCKVFKVFVPSDWNGTVFMFHDWFLTARLTRILKTLCMGLSRGSIFKINNDATDESSQQLSILWCQLNCRNMFLITQLGSESLFTHLQTFLGQFEQMLFY